MASEQPPRWPRPRQSENRTQPRPLTDKIAQVFLFGMIAGAAGYGVGFGISHLFGHPETVNIFQTPFDVGGLEGAGIGFAGGAIGTTAYLESRRSGYTRRMPPRG